MAKVNFDISKRLDITTRKGDSFSLQLTLKVSNGIAINLYGSTGEAEFLMNVRRNKEFSGGNGVIMWSSLAVPPQNENFIPNQLTITLTDTESSTTADTSSESYVASTAATGILTISADDTIMKDVPSGRYVYDLQYKDQSSVVKTILFGSFTVNDDISEPVA